MEAWVWLTAYVAGFGLLQLLLYRHFRQRRTATPERGDHHVGGRTTPTGDTDATPTNDADTAACQHCGTVNERHSMVRYCRSCAESLR